MRPPADTAPAAAAARSPRSGWSPATNHAIHDKRRKEHIREVEGLIEQLNAKLPTVQNSETDPKRRERIAKTIKTLEKRLFNVRERPERQRPGRRR